MGYIFRYQFSYSTAPIKDQPVENWVILHYKVTLPTAMITGRSITFIVAELKNSYTVSQVAQDI